MTRTRWFAPGPDLGNGLLSFVAGGTLSRDTKVGTELEEGQPLWYPGRYPGRVSLGQGAAALFGAEGYNRMPRGMLRQREGKNAGAGQDVIQGGWGREAGCQGDSGVPGGEQRELRTEGKHDHKKKPPKDLPIKDIPKKQPNGQPIGHHMSGAIPGVAEDEPSGEVAPQKRNKQKAKPDAPGSVAAQDSAGQAEGMRGSVRGGGSVVQGNAPGSTGMQIIDSASPASGRGASPAHSAARSHTAGAQHGEPALTRGQAQSVVQHAPQPPAPPPPPPPQPQPTSLSPPAPVLPLRPVMPTSRRASIQPRSAANSQTGGEPQSQQRQPELPGPAQGGSGERQVEGAAVEQPARDEDRGSGTAYRITHRTAEPAARDSANSTVHQEHGEADPGPSQTQHNAPAAAGRSSTWISRIASDRAPSGTSGCADGADLAIELKRLYLMENGNLRRQIHDAETLLLELLDDHETPGSERYVSVLEWEPGSEHSAVSIREQNGKLADRLGSLEARIGRILGTQDNLSRVPGPTDEAQLVRQGPTEAARSTGGRQESAEGAERSSQQRNSASSSHVGRTAELMRAHNVPTAFIHSRRLRRWVDEQGDHGRDEDYHSARDPSSPRSSITLVSQGSRWGDTDPDSLTARNLGQLPTPSSTTQDSHDTIQAGTGTHGPRFVRPRVSR